MEYLLLILGLCCIIFGVVGSLLPALPGLPVSWLGILLLYLTPDIAINYWFLGVSLLVMLVITIADYIIPAQGTKKFGGSKYGVWGTNIGLIVGLIAPIPFGFIIGPFAGALIGELIYDKKDTNRATRAAFGSFLGFLAGTFVKFVFSMVFLGLFIYLVSKNWYIYF